MSLDRESKKALKVLLKAKKPTERAIEHIESRGRKLERPNHVAEALPHYLAALAASGALSGLSELAGRTKTMSIQSIRRSFLEYLSYEFACVFRNVHEAVFRAGSQHGIEDMELLNKEQFRVYEAMAQDLGSVNIAFCLGLGDRDGEGNAMQFFELACNRLGDYENCDPVMPPEDQGMRGNLYWEGGRRVVTALCGYHDPILAMIFLSAESTNYRTMRAFVMSGYQLS